jgi:hypothetical protein
MGEDAVYLLTAYSEPKRVGFERINLQDGTSGGEKILEVASDFDVGSMWFSILGWDQQHVWVVMTDIVALYNFQTGELVNRWP